MDSSDLLTKAAKYLCVGISIMSGVAGILRALYQKLLWQSIEIGAVLAAVCLIFLHPGFRQGWHLKAMLLACMLPFAARVAYEVMCSVRLSSSTRAASSIAQRDHMPVEDDDLLNKASPAVQRLAVRVADLLPHLESSDALAGPEVTNARTNVHSLFRFIGRRQTTPHTVAVIHDLINDTEAHIGSDQVGTAIVNLLREMACLRHEGGQP